MTQEEITEGNKLIAEFMGFIYPYKCSISRGGYAMMEVDLLSKIKFMTLPELLASDINNEGAPYYNNGGISIGKYGGASFYHNVVFFSTETETVPVTLTYNERFQAYHSEWNWLMPVIIKINDLTVVNEKCFINYEKIESTLLELDIEKLHEAVVEFIKWYNQNK